MTPGAAEWKWELGQLLEGEADSGAVFAHLEDALTRSPTDPDLLQTTALAALVAGVPDRALRLQKRLRKRYVPNRSDAVLQSLGLAMTGGAGAARRALMKAVGTADPRAVYASLPFTSAAVEEWFWPLYRSVISGARSQTPSPSRRQRPPAPERRAAEPTTTKGSASKPTPSAPKRNAPEAATGAPRLDERIPEIPVRLLFDFCPDTAPESDPRWHTLRRALAELRLFRGFDELLCLPTLRGVDTYAHQVETAKKVLKLFRGRVLLADEVGLGKTVEAGMIIKEYLLRGMVSRVLVLTPASLVSQWQEELACKFGLDFRTTNDPELRSDPTGFWKAPRIIASLAVARRQDHGRLLLDQVHDLVVVDEAHRLKNSRTRSYRLVNDLKKRFILLLSATPVQNSLLELYNILTLLKPGIFQTQKEFRNRYMTPGNPRVPLNPEALRDLMRDVMVRNTRSVVDVPLPPRHATTLRAEASDEEAACYRALSDMIRQACRGDEGRSALRCRQWLIAAGSSPAAVVRALESAKNLPGDPGSWAVLRERYARIALGSKEAVLLRLLQDRSDAQMLVFVNRIATLERLRACLEAAGVSCGVFHGSLRPEEKDQAIEDFRAGQRVLLTTESGGEGRNLQFVHTLVNFDLPWNPMALEQRIGRIHRIGQSKDVFVFNLSVRDTVEDHLLTILDEKINMFQLVVGEIGDILGELEEDRDFSQLVFDAWVASEAGAEANAMDDLAKKMVEARERLRSAKELDEALFGDEFEVA